RSLALSPRSADDAPGALFRLESSQAPAAASLEQTTASVAEARLPNERAVTASLVQSMQWQYRNGVGMAVVQLDPGYLGEVRVALQVEGANVSATLHAANPEVRQWMQANEGALRESLAAQGLSLDRLTVAEDEDTQHRASPDGRGHAEDERERPRQPRRPTSAHESPTFEVVV
ncbi:MAG: flagellar hook-length control protein FliK, partial [Vicinamibacterales bacterium]